MFLAFCCPWLPKNPLDVTDGAGGGEQNKVRFSLSCSGQMWRALGLSPGKGAGAPASCHDSVWTKVEVLKAPHCSFLVIANSQAELRKHEELFSWQRQPRDIAAGRGQVDIQGHNKTLHLVLSRTKALTEKQKRGLLSPLLPSHTAGNKTDRQTHTPEPGPQPPSVLMNTVHHGCLEASTSQGRTLKFGHCERMGGFKSHGTWMETVAA